MMSTQRISSVWAVAVAALVLGTAAHAGSSAYRNAVLADNPIVYYEFDETSGTTAANSGSLGATHDGTIVSTVTLGQSSFAEGGTAYDFGGGRVTGAAFSTLTEWTVEAWINWDSAKTSQSHIFGNDQAGWNDDVLFGIGTENGNLGVPASNVGCIQQSADQSTTRDVVTEPLSHSEWHHVVATGSDAAGALKLYVDGVLVDTDSSLTLDATMNGYAFSVGSDGAYNRTFDGLIDEFALYDTVLDAPTIEAHCEEGSGTIIEFNGMIQGNNTDVPADFSSNLDSSISGATIFGRGTPGVELTWEGGVDAWELHGKGNDYWDALDTHDATVCIAQLQRLQTADEIAIRFTVADGVRLQLNSLDIGQYVYHLYTTPNAYTIAIKEVDGGATVYSHTTATLSPGNAEHVTLNFTGERGVDYRLVFTDNTSDGNYGGGIDNLSFGELPADVHQSIIEFNGMSQGNNADVPADFASNLGSSISGVAIFGRGTPDVELTWEGGANAWDLHGKANDLWDALDTHDATVCIAQMEALKTTDEGAITFTVADGVRLQLNSLDIGQFVWASYTTPNAYTIAIKEVDGGATVFSHTTATLDPGDAEHVTFNFTGEQGVDYRLVFTDNTSDGNYGGGIDNLSFGEVPAGIILSDATVASNAVIGTLVGTLSYIHNLSGVTYTLPVTGTGPDSASFQIGGASGLRTAATIDQGSYDISIAAHRGGSPLVTNDFTITVDAVGDTYSAFIVSAEAGTGVADGSEVVGILRATGTDPSAFAFSLSGGRTDLFEIDGTGTNVVQVAGTDPGATGSLHYFEIEAANDATTNHLVVAVEVVFGDARGSLFMFQ